MLRRFALALLLATSTLTIAPPLPATAAVENDIPGVPVTGNVVNGELTGSTYDLVYQVDVPKGYVLVANLRSDTPGTDFDLYLWPPTATTVYAQSGYLVRSNKAGTSTEVITWAATADTRVYLDVTRFGPTGGTFQLLVALSADSTPPVARLLLNGGATISNAATVDVLAGGYDNLSGVTQVALSEDGVTWGDWQDAPLQTSWTFTTGDGVRSLWAKAKNGVGLPSSGVKASIRIDTTAPAVKQISPPRDSVVTVERQPISVTFTEPIDPASWQDGGLVVTGPNGTPVPGSLTYVATTQTGTFTPSVPLTLGAIYVASVGPIRDLAGNAIGSAESWTLKRLVAGRITISVPVKTVTYGSRLSFTGSTNPSGPLTVTLRHRPEGASAWQDVVAATAEGSTYQLIAQPLSSGRYRVQMAATETSGPAASTALAIVVKRAIRLEGTGPGVVRRGTAGAVVAVRARVTPGVANLATVFRLYRRSGTKWVLSSSRTIRTDATGAATYRWKPRAGRWAWRVTAGGTALLAANTTPYYQWRIGR